MNHTHGLYYYNSNDINGIVVNKSGDKRVLLFRFIHIVDLRVKRIWDYSKIEIFHETDPLESELVVQSYLLLIMTTITTVFLLTSSRIDRALNMSWVHWKDLSLYRAHSSLSQMC